MADEAAPAVDGPEPVVSTAGVGPALEPFTAPPLALVRRRTWLRALLVTAGVLVVSTVVAVVVFFQVFDVYWIPSAAMAPTLDEGDRVIVRGIAGDEVHRGDVVIVEQPASDGQGSVEVIKRVIAVGGDVIVGVDGGVQLNGERLDEPYLGPDTTTTDLPFQRVPADHVFVMGDNRTNSADSRMFGPIAHDDVVALAVSTWPPPGDGF